MAEQGKRPVLAIMRPERYVKGSVKLAESLGFEPIAAPMVELASMKDDEFDPFIERVLSGKSDYVIFTSANGMAFTLDKIPDSRRQDFIDALNSTNVIAIGPATRKSLENFGINIMGIPGVYSSEGIVDYLCSSVKGKIIDMARSYYGSSLLNEGLLKCGAIVHETQIYTIIRPEGEIQIQFMNDVFDRKITVFAFTSSMMVHNFFEYAREIGNENDVVSILNESIVAAIGGPTAKILDGYGVKSSIIPGKFTFEEVLKKVLEVLGTSSS
jgi:uroporphyrinogen-III synthase